MADTAGVATWMQQRLRPALVASPRLDDRGGVQGEPDLDLEEVILQAVAGVRPGVDAASRVEWEGDVYR